MKKKFSSSKYKKQNKQRAANRLKRKLKHKEWKKNRRRKEQGKSKVERKEGRLIENHTTVKAPDKFSFIKYPKETTNFINKLEKLYLNRKKAFVNLSKIELLDYSAVTVLVSVMFSFKARRIDFNGNFPENENLAKILIDSGFFKYLNKPIGDKIEYTIGKQNQIFTRANKKVNPELGLVVMQEMSQTIWGEKRTCKGMQRVLLELMQNTNNHADINQKGVKHWWLSVNHNKEANKVSFVFVDYGVGIFESLNNKPKDNKWFGWFDKIKTRLTHGQNYEILKLLLEGELHMTVTGQPFRGKGLPGIKEVFDRNQISNLHIISNSVFANVSENKYSTIGSNFSGTFVYWEIDKNNDSLKWIN